MPSFGINYSLTALPHISDIFHEEARSALSRGIELVDDKVSDWYISKKGTDKIIALALITS